MITSEVIENNKRSWENVTRFIETLPDIEGWAEWKVCMGAVIEGCMGLGLDQYFRAGISVGHIIFSTAERHGLELLSPDPPRVTFGYDNKFGMFVAWSHSNIWFNDPERRDFVTPECALSVLKKYLAALWRETRPTEPVPSAVEPASIR